MTRQMPKHASAGRLGRRPWSTGSWCDGDGPARSGDHPPLGRAPPPLLGTGGGVAWGGDELAGEAAGLGPAAGADGRVTDGDPGSWVGTAGTLGAGVSTGVDAGVGPCEGPGVGPESAPTRLPTVVPEGGDEPPTQDAAGRPVIASTPVIAPSAMTNTRTEAATGTAQIGMRRDRRPVREAPAWRWGAGGVATAGFGAGAASSSRGGVSCLACSASARRRPWCPCRGSSSSTPRALEPVRRNTCE